jgi:hypothetical protein
MVISFLKELKKTRTTRSKNRFSPNIRETASAEVCSIAPGMSVLEFVELERADCDSEF